MWTWLTSSSQTVRPGGKRSASSWSVFIVSPSSCRPFTKLLPGKRTCIEPIVPVCSSAVQSSPRSHSCRGVRSWHRSRTCPAQSVQSNSVQWGIPVCTEDGAANIGEADTRLQGGCGLVLLQYRIHREELRSRRAAGPPARPPPCCRLACRPCLAPAPPSLPCPAPPACPLCPLYDTGPPSRDRHLSDLFCRPARPVPSPRHINRFC